MRSVQEDVLCTFAEPQPLCECWIGGKDICQDMGHKHKLLQCGGPLLLLSTRGHCGMKTRDLDSTSNNVV